MYTILYGMLSRAFLERQFIHYLQGFIAIVYVRLFISCDILSGGNTDGKRVTGMHGETGKDEGISKKREATGVYYNSLLIRDQKYHLPHPIPTFITILKNLKSRSYHSYPIYYSYHTNPIS